MSLDYGNNEFGGGIDPRTGYTRRAQYRYTGYDFSSPLSISYLIETTAIPFVAGDISSNSEYCETYKNKTIDKTVLIFLLFFCIISLLLLGYFCYKSTNFNKKTILYSS